MTQDSDTRPEPSVDEALDSVLERIESVPPVLSGEPVDVTLTIKVAGAFTPEEAVDQFMLTLLRVGANSLYFFVQDADGEEFAIKNGELFAPPPEAVEDDEDEREQ